MLDCIVIGSGPAGISAVLTLQANKKTFVLLGKKYLSEKILKAEKIHNYPGLTDVSGMEFCQRLQTQLSIASIDVVEEKAIGVYPMQGKIGVATQEGGYYEAKTLILACGVETVKTLKGEEGFSGKGVSYCATCDGFLYKDKIIFVLCTSKRLEHEIEHLAGFAKQVYLFTLYKDLGELPSNVTIIKKMPKEITGSTRVEKVVFDGEEVAVDGVFILKEGTSPTTLLSGLEMQDGHVMVDKNTATNIDGVFACGDCTGRPYQYAKAVGEGNVSAHAVTKYVYENQ